MVEPPPELGTLVWAKDIEGKLVNGFVSEFTIVLGQATTTSFIAFP